MSDTQVLQVSFSGDGLSCQVWIKEGDNPVKIAILEAPETFFLQEIIEGLLKKGENQ